MRSFVISTFALALAAAPAVAQPPSQTTSTTQQPPAGQPPAAQPPAAAQPAAPAAPKLAFTTPAGLLLVQVKPDQTAVFEEMMDKIKKGVAAASDADVKAQAGAWKYYKAAEPAGANVMYVVVIDPVKPGTEYQFFEVIQKTLSDDEKRNPATAEMYKKYAASIASMNKLNVTPMGGGL